MNNLEIEIELQALICEREGMIAENMARESLGQSMAYNDSSFSFLAAKFRELKINTPSVAGGENNNYNRS